MENSRSKKAVAASLSLALALGSVPGVALADDEGQSDNSSEESQQRASYTFSANGGQFGSSDVANIEANEDGSVDAPTPHQIWLHLQGLVFYLQPRSDS